MDLTNASNTCMIDVDGRGTPNNIGEIHMVVAGLKARFILDVAKIEMALEDAGIDWKSTKIDSDEYTTEVLADRGEDNIRITEGIDSLFSVYVNDCHITNMAYPHLVGRVVTERRHIGLFE